jgi:predicted nucleotidyltransferase
MVVSRSLADADKQIATTLELINSILEQKLLGVYLYGSYTIGGLQPYSDLDFFAVLNSATNDNEKKQLISGLLDKSIEDPNDTRRPIELTMAMQNQLQPWSKTSEMDFQFGEWMRKDFVKGNLSPWTNPNTDLAIIVTQVLNNGKKLYGQDPAELMDTIPIDDVKAVMESEIEDLLPEVQEDTRNVILTLVRIWNTLKTNIINSKQDAADWALGNVPDEFKPALQHARDVCIGNSEEDLNVYQAVLDPLINYLVSEIRKATRDEDG